MIVAKTIVFFIALLFSIFAMGNIAIDCASVVNNRGGRTNLASESIAAGAWAVFYCLSNLPE